MGVTGVITTFSFTGCGLPVLTSTDTVPKLGVAGPDAGMAGASKTGTSGTAVGTGDPVETSALLAGDIEAEQELALVDAGLAPVHLLLVPHHGSKTSSTQPFLQALQPRLALVQAGYRNRYGHPAEPVVTRYRAQGIELIESTRCGAAAWRSQTPNQVQCERVQSRRYWHHIIPP